MSVTRGGRSVITALSYRSDTPGGSSVDVDQRSANPQVATTVGAAEQPALHPELPRYVDGTEDETHHAVHDHNEMGQASLRLSLDGLGLWVLGSESPREVRRDRVLQQVEC